MKKAFLILLLFNSYAVIAQNVSGKDSAAFLDSIYREMDEILDQMVPRKNYFSASVGAGTGFFNFKNFSNENYDREKKIMLSPSLSFYHKIGLGISATANLISENKFNLYQASVSPSYDYIKRGKWSTGIAYTRYFTKNNLAFYTTPISNELSAYYSLKKYFIQPAVSLAYGWGSRTEYEERKTDVLLLRRHRNPRVVTVRNDHSIRDLSLLISARHDIDFFKLFSSRDLLTITPVVALSSGTQNFGLNTSFTSDSKQLNNFLPNNQNLSDKNSFDLQSASAVLRADYSIDIFYFQSQFLFDYYLHLTPQRSNTAFALIAGVNF